MSKIAIVGLGRMGGNMARRLRQGGAEVVAYNRNHAVAQQLAAETGLVAVETLPLLVESLGGEGRMIWLMLPAGDATQQALKTLIPLLGAGDIVVDGANAFYKDSQRRAKELETWGIRFVDVGVSGGVWGLKNGYAMMIGGEAEAVRQLEYFLKILAPAPDKGWLHCGPAGAGHFVKMIHNGIEYGMMQAFAEGFALMKGKQEFDLDLAAISEMWRHGSVVRSWLLDLSADFLKEDQDLGAIAPFVSDSGEGRWTAFEAIEQGVPAPVMSLALMMRFASQGSNDFPAKMLAMMRKGFGGHAIKEG